jgi:hypothetical protein
MPLDGLNWLFASDLITTRGGTLYSKPSSKKSGTREIQWNGFVTALPVDAEVDRELVAVTGADGDLVTALGATTAEDGSAGLGLHAGEETVGLRAVAAVGLESTLRHGIKLLRRRELLLKLLGCCNNL